jgi:hypothetical protein
MSEMKSKLETFKTLEIAINGSSEDLALRLHEMGDYSQVIKFTNFIGHKKDIFLALTTFQLITWYFFSLQKMLT